MARNDPELQRLQQDAIRRVQEMQSRAQHLTPPPGNPQKASPAPRAPEAEQKREPKPEGHPAAPARMPQASGGGPIKDIFEALLSDSERTLILLLILLLSDEKGDPGLIFALMYLAL